MPAFTIIVREHVVKKHLIDADYANDAITKCLAGDPYVQTFSEEVKEHAVLECRHATPDEIGCASRMLNPRETDDV